MDFPVFKEAEAAVLGTVIVYGNESLFLALEKLSGDEFYFAPHQDVFAAIKQLHAKNYPIGIDTVTKELLALNAWERTIGVDYLLEVVDKAVTPESLLHWIEITKEYHNRRKIILACQETMKAAADTSQELAAAMSIVENACFDVTAFGEEGGIQSVDEVITETYKILEDRFDNNTSPGIKTGFHDVDRIMGGLIVGELVILAGRPGMGKSAWALEVADNCSADGHETFLFSLEMTKPEIGNRLFSYDSKVELHTLHAGKLTPDVMGKVTDSLGRIAGRRLHIDDSALLRPSEIYAKILGYCLRYGISPRVIVIDYFQLLTPDDRSGNREQELADMSRTFKRLAKRLKCTVILVSQLNRDCEKRDDKHPRLSDLRETGALENDANVVVGFYRHGYYTKRPEDANSGEACLLKSRAGATVNVPLYWVPEIAAYKNYANFEFSA